MIQDPTHRKVRLCAAGHSQAEDRAICMKAGSSRPCCTHTVYDVWGPEDVMEAMLCVLALSGPLRFWQSLELYNKGLEPEKKYSDRVNVQSVQPHKEKPFHV